MKKILTIAVAALLLTACSKNNTYTIEGSFNIPETYDLADTTLTRGPIEGYVYLINLDGSPIDSAQIVDEKFSFSGIVNPEMPYYAYLVSEYAAGMLAIEPGCIKAVVGEPFVVTGTTTNDAIAKLMSDVDSIGYDFFDELSALQDSAASPTDSTFQFAFSMLQNKYDNIVTDMVESLYEANQENLIGVYCANVTTVQARSADELESLLERYSEYVRNSELIQLHLEYLKKAESDYSGEDYLGD